MDELESRLHKTWVNSLIEFKFRELAAIAIDFKVSLNQCIYDDFGRYFEYTDSITLDIPVSSYKIAKEQNNNEILEKTLLGVCNGHLQVSIGKIFDSQKDELKVIYRVALLDVEEDWKNVAKRLINESRHPNQGVVTETVFGREGKDVLIYNEMKFASKSEIRIAQELEERGVLFFPLPLAVRKETEVLYKDHREVDFIICENGLWGILEVAHHLNRYEQDKEKDAWFKKSGILCIEHFTWLTDKSYVQRGEIPGIGRN